VASADVPVSIMDLERQIVRSSCIITMMIGAGMGLIG
jgi:hypothetical protein